MSDRHRQWEFRPVSSLLRAGMIGWALLSGAGASFTMAAFIEKGVVGGLVVLGLSLSAGAFAIFMRWVGDI